MCRNIGPRFKGFVTSFKTIYGLHSITKDIGSSSEYCDSFFKSLDDVAVGVRLDFVVRFGRWGDHVPRRSVPMWSSIVELR